MITIGQEALRASLAGSDAAQARRQAITSVGHHNLELGPVMFRFATGLDTEYNSNVRYRRDNPQCDIIFRPSLQAGAYWPVSEKNMLFINSDFGYSAYVDNTELNRIYVRPGTEVSFDIYFKDLVINLHDRPYISQYAYQDPTVSGIGDFAQLQNTVGASALWDLNDAILSFGYDHNNYWGLNSESRERDGASDLFFLSGGFRVRPELTLGLDFGATWINYAESTYPDAFQASSGAFARYILSDLMNVRVNAGYVLYSPENTAAFPDLEDSDLFYVQLALNHRINEYLTYALSASHGYQISFYGGTYESYQATLNMNWHLFREISLSTPVSFRQSSPVAASEDDFIYYGGGVRAGRQMTEKLRAALGFNVYVKDSDTRTLSYTVFLVSLDLRYQF